MSGFTFEYAPEDYDWSDIVPIPQQEPNPVVAIMYTAECKRTSTVLLNLTELLFIFTVKELMGIFRALVYKREYSERGLDLTETLLDLNPASYTVW